MTATLGWGVVGTGDVSRYLSSDLAMLDSAHRVAVSSRSIDKADAFARELGFERGVGSLHELLSDAAVDMVYVGTPHSTHVDIAVAALEAGKHVLVEKPMGVDAADVERVASAARASDRFAMEAMWMKFHPYYRAVLKEVRGGSIGRVQGVRASFGLPFGEPHSDRWSSERSSSTLLDQGIYPVTFALDVLGGPTAIDARARVRDDGVDLTVYATLEFVGGQQAQIAASMVEYIDPSASVNGTEGWITVPAPFWAGRGFTRHRGSIGEALTAPTSVDFDREGFGYVPMLRAVTETVLAGSKEHPLHPLSATAAVAHILDAIRAAAVAHPISTEIHA